MKLQTQKPNVQTQYTREKDVKQRRQSKFGLSQTVPDQAQQLSRIMDKYNVGVPTSGYRPIYSEDLENDRGINPKTLDYVDIQNLKRENQNKIEQINQDHQSILMDQQIKANEKILSDYEAKIREKIQKENQQP